MIEFNKPPFIGTELEYIRQAAEENNKLCGDGPFTKKCSAWMHSRRRQRLASKVMRRTIST